MKILLALLPLLFLSCNRGTVKDAINAMQSGANLRTLVAGAHKIEIRYMPGELRCLLSAHLDPKRVLTSALWDSLRIEGCVQEDFVFSLRLSPKLDTLSPLDYSNSVTYGTISGTGDYRKTVETYAFGLSGKIWLERGGKRYDLSNYQMSRSWGMTKSEVFMLLFNPIATSSSRVPLDLVLVVENLVPGQGRDKLRWTNAGKT
jgi:hypothetical protein